MSHEPDIRGFLSRVQQLMQRSGHSGALTEERVAIEAFTVRSAFDGETITVRRPNNLVARYYLASVAEKGSSSVEISDSFIAGVAELFGGDFYLGLSGDPRLAFLRGILLGSHIEDIVWKTEGG